MKRRTAFTMVELLVVVSIIGILVGLIMPAVQYAREAANRTACANNLKQLGMAAHHFELYWRALPPSRLQLQGATWAVLLMPYMEHDNLYKSWDLNESYFRQSAVARESVMPTHFCPSRRDALGPPTLSILGDEPTYEDGTLGPQVPGALGDYACNIGTTGADWMHLMPSMPSCNMPPTGSFQLSNQGMPTNGLTIVGVRLVQISDGLSNTLLIGEKHVPLGHFGEGGWDCSLYDGAGWYCSGRAAGIAFPLADSIRDPEWKFGSYHPHLCQFVYVDGSVHALSSGIDPNTLELLGNIADGEVLPPFDD